jgi:hypothetical protein
MLITQMGRMGIILRWILDRDNQKMQPVKCHTGLGWERFERDRPVIFQLF